MHGSVEAFVGQVARRGSWYGGGSAAALSGALSAALLEKLLLQPAAVRRLRRVRHSCLRLIEEDARSFAQVIAATRSPGRRRFQRALKAATEVPWQVFRHAQAVQALCRKAQRSVKPRWQSDLRCAMALALAAAESARTLIQTNLTWLNDRAYARTMQRRLQAAARRPGASS